MTARLRLAEVDRIRYQRGSAVLLFLTDRCPVGCLHCSVDSRRDGPRVTDHDLLRDIVGALARYERVSMVGISGGEPFIERRALSESVATLAAAGKQVVLYTSGVWARANPVPEWITTAVSRAACLFMSTDAFHQAMVDQDRFVAALRAVADQGAPIVVQALDRPQDMASVRELLTRAFGAGWAAYAEINPLVPLPYGRGETVFARPAPRAGETLGHCQVAATPVVRYDGAVTACCNETLIMGHGPERLRERYSSGREVVDALDRIWADPFLRLLNAAGTAALTGHPRYADMAAETYRGICDFCSHAQRRTPALGTDTDPSLAALAALAEAGVR
jgi:organic radical activating enzyme